MFSKVYLSTSQDTSHAKGQFRHLKNLKLADSNIDNESLPFRILIRSGIVGIFFENEIIRGERGTPITMKTKFRNVLSGPVAKIQNLSNPTLICHSLNRFTEIPNNERMQKNLVNRKI